MTPRSLRNQQAVEQLIDAVSSPMARLRLGAAKALRTLSEREPDLLYPHFEFFDTLRRSGNSVLRWNAMLVMGNLAPVDDDEKADAILDDYLAPIRGPHLIDAANTMRGATAMAVAKPHLADRIARAILEVEAAHYKTPECRRVATGHAINAFARLMPLVTDKSALQLFVARQLKNSRAATRKKAEAFLRRFQSLEKRAT
jgi:hypothetical protein